MQMTPCRTCPFKETCDIRVTLRAAVRGLGLTALRFRCDALLGAFRPGMKVKARLDYVAVGSHVAPDDFQWKTEKRIVDAYVMKFTGGKVRIFVPYDESPDYRDGLPEWWLQKLKGTGYGELFCIHVLRVNPDRLVATGEAVNACHHCGMPETHERPDGWSCRTVDEERGGGYTETVECECDFRPVEL